MFAGLTQTFQAVILWSIICKVHARDRPHPVMSIYNREIRFYPRQSYCLTLLKVIEDTGGYYGAHVLCQRSLCKHYHSSQKICASNRVLLKTFRNQCLLCAKGCEELNRGRSIFRNEYLGECGTKVTTEPTTNAVSTSETPVRITSSLRPTGPSTSSTKLITNPTERLSNGTTSITDDGRTPSFTIVVDGTTVVVSTAQPFTSPFASTTTQSLLPTLEDFTTSATTFEISSSVLSTTTSADTTFSVVSSSSMPTTPTPTIRKDIKSTETKRSSLSPLLTEEFTTSATFEISPSVVSTATSADTTFSVTASSTSMPTTPTPTIRKDIKSTKTKCSSLSPLFTQDFTTSATFESSPSIRSSTTSADTASFVTAMMSTSKIITDIKTTETKRSHLTFKTPVSPQERVTTPSETKFVFTTQKQIPTLPTLSALDEFTTGVSSFISTFLYGSKEVPANTVTSTTEELIETREPLAPKNLCVKEKHKFDGSEPKYQVNIYLEEQFCVRNDKYFPIKCETIGQGNINGKLSTQLPVLPLFIKGR